MESQNTQIHYRIHPGELATLVVSQWKSFLIIVDFLFTMKKEIVE